MQKVKQSFFVQTQHETKQIIGERNYTCGLARPHEELLTVKIAAVKTGKEETRVRNKGNIAAKIY
jgi:hypothetical protein